MSEWLPYPIPISFPGSLTCEVDEQNEASETVTVTKLLANKLANIIDPDVGGAFTFSADRVVNGYCWATIPFITTFLPIVESRDPDIWFEAMSRLAEERGRDPLTREEIELLCASMKMGDEVEMTDENKI